MNCMHCFCNQSSSVHGLFIPDKTLGRLALLVPCNHIHGWYWMRGHLKRKPRQPSMFQVPLKHGNMDPALHGRRRTQTHGRRGFGGFIELQTHSRWEAVGGREHPVGGDERAPAYVSVGPLLDVHLPRPRPLHRITSSHDAVLRGGSATHCRGRR